MVRIKEIQVVSIKPNNGLVGFASLVFEDSLYLGSIGIYTRPNGGYRLAYPTRKGVGGSFNIYHPINREVANEIEQAVITKFEEVMNLYDRHNQTNAQ